MKDYFIRVYITSDFIGLIMNDAIDSGMFELVNSFDGINGLLAVYDGKVSRKGLIYIMALGINIFPLNNYGSFIITCPNCGNRINDDMILLSYDENVLSGYNINCNIKDCGCQVANIKLIE